MPEDKAVEDTNGQMAEVPIASNFAVAIDEVPANNDVVEQEEVEQELDE